MNYRHAFHAGNFADVLKHLVLVLAIEHLKLKPQPFRIVDTHAGIGLYDLGGVEAGKTGEWQGGIGRIVAADLSPEVAAIVAPYLELVRRYLAEPPAPGRYPGSPLIARDLMRDGDTLVLNELHPEDRAALDMLFRRDKAVKVLGLDGYTVVKATLPPKERRGLLLVDPPFEEAGEFERMTTAMTEAHRRFAGGTQIHWYPIKDAAAVARFHRSITAAAIAETLVVEMAVRPPRSSAPGLAATGLVVVNPPYTLREKLALALPELTSALALERGATCRVEWLVTEQAIKARS